MVRNAGVIEAEVVLVSKKSENATCAGCISTSANSSVSPSEDESIRYQIRTPRDGGEIAPCVLAGPTCDSAE